MPLQEPKTLQAKLHSRILGCVVLVCGVLVLTTFSQKKPDPQTNPIIQKATQLLEQGNLIEAEALLQSHLIKTPNDARSRVLLGVVFDREDRLAEAESLYREVLKKSPNEISALANLGVLLVKTKRIDEAVKVLERVLQLQPNHQQAAYNLATIYSAQNKQNRALPLLKKLAGVRPDRTLPTTTDISLLVALTKVYAATGMTKEAVKIAELLEKKQAGDPRLLFTLGLIFSQANEYEKGKQLFEKVNAQMPNRFEVLYNLGIAYYNLNEFDQAQTVLRSAVDIDPTNAEVFYRLGLVASAKKEVENALGLWLKAVELRPEFHEANFLIAEELSKRQAYVGAQQFYEKAGSQELDNLLYQVRLCVTYIRIQQYENARAILDVQDKKRPDNLNITYLKGFLARAEGNYDEAIVAFEKVLRLTANNPDALANLGFLAGERGQYEKAEALLKQSIKEDPKIFSAHYDLGRLLLRLKRVDDALAILERGAELNKSDPGIRYQLFIAYSRTKQKAKADVNFAEFKRLEALTAKTGASATSRDNNEKIPDSVLVDKP